MRTTGLEAGSVTPAISKACIFVWFGLSLLLTVAADLIATDDVVRAQQGNTLADVSGKQDKMSVYSLASVVGVISQ